jgi:sporulation protein YunB
VIYIKLVLVLILSAFLLIYIDNQIRPVIKNVAGYQGKIIATKAINEAMSEELDEAEYTYKDIVIIDKNNEGNINSIEINSIMVNKIKASVSKRIITKISNVDDRKLKIPIGSFLGAQMLSGRGPKVDFIIKPSGTIETNMTSEFLEAGVNQTKHRITLNIKVKVTAIIPAYSTSVEVPTNFILAETIIVGQVPNYSLNMPG